ncbi:iron-sulfur cluster biosynthesis family protein [Desulfosporosinus sp. PR]|uniref:HesB/IscA family protein n=1 Tax=Candidatus Desulfosporosinus nitrosoreducens TaxID=3401928 RepID=UPI0027FACF8B|nr:iron-sulfur cluster biosynthesis family protein [Desulfosporosinus sp. PR]MDQ7092886.1 iron-sulfur cluster biosynthesis family protein [Desulfosporosinus sp. PR]
MVKITELAVQKIKEMQQSKHKENDFLRIYLISEGCGIPSYGLTLEETKKEDDLLEFNYGLSILTDKKLASIEEIIVDYIETKRGGGFEIRKSKKAR